MQQLNQSISCTMALRILIAIANSVHIVPSRPSTRNNLLPFPNNRCERRIANSKCLGKSARDQIRALQHFLMGEIGRICAEKNHPRNTICHVHIHIFTSSHSIAPHFFTLVAHKCFDDFKKKRVPSILSWVQSHKYSKVSLD